MRGLAKYFGCLRDVCAGRGGRRLAAQVRLFIRPWPLKFSAEGALHRGPGQGVRPTGDAALGRDAAPGCGRLPLRGVDALEGNGDKAPGLSRRALLLVVVMAGTAGLAPAQELAIDEVATVDPDLPVVAVEAEFRDRSWFTDRVATTVVKFPEVVEAPEVLPDGGDDVSIAGLDVHEAEEGGSQAVVRWLPRREGVITFPALSFVSDQTRFAVAGRQIMVSIPQRTPEMELEFSPGKKTVHVGEPLRVDVRWSCRLTTKRLKSLRCNPAFLTDADIEVVVPRATAPEKEQLGLPFGGRRVVARRTAGDDNGVLGEVRFPIYLRFDEPGRHTLPATRLECAFLKADGGAFAPYAAYFNNALFDVVDAGVAYDRLFVDSNPIEIEVLPLPEEGRLESFSGLFAPCAIEVSVEPAECVVGTVVEVDLLVRSEAPHGFLELPDLRHQRSLRSWFKVEGEPGRAWHAEGTTFRARMRALTTRVKALPALQIQVFDPGLGEYVLAETKSVPLAVHAHEGRDYFDAKTVPGDEGGLSDQPEGIWQNDQRNLMNDAWNTISGILSDYFWLWMAVGPVLFLLLLPWAREGRRRALNPAYRKLVDAYRVFRRSPEGGGAKWIALRDVIAAGLAVDPEALTAGDVRQRLSEQSVPEEDIEVVVQSVVALDAETFSEAKKSAVLPSLGLVGERIYKVLSKLVVVMIFTSLTGMVFGGVTDWEEAETLFGQALQGEAGAAGTSALFSRSALKFEVVARSGERPGVAWHNAGNAWFNAGEIGRSIACYRQAEVYRPFDDTVRQNLKAARALAVDVVDADRTRSRFVWPVRWLRAVLVPVVLVSWLLLLAFVRFRKIALLAGTGACIIVALTLAVLAIVAKIREGTAGVVIVPEVFGRKGPSYRYRTAFHEPLHDGLEFAVLERRGDWVQIQLADDRRCWIPEAQVRLVFNPN